LSSSSFTFLQHVARLYAETLDQQLGAGPPQGIIDDDQLIWLGILCSNPQVLRPMRCDIPLLPYAAYCGIVGEKPCMTWRRYNCPVMYLSLEYQPEDWAVSVL
jgi:hypothetical protein